MVDRLTKATHLTLVKVRYPTKTYAELYIPRIDCLYGVPRLPHRIKDLSLLPLRIKPGYIGPFRILQQYGPVAYQLKMPPHLSSTHDVFQARSDLSGET